MKYLIHITLASILFCLAVRAAHPGAMSENYLIQNYLKELKESEYNPDVLPDGNHGWGTPVDVLCTMYILDINKVDDSNMDYKADFYFRQSWNDSRLAYLDQDILQITLDNPNLIWTPDLFFVQAKEGIHHRIITPNVFLRISPEGEVLFSVRLSMTFSCPMDFSMYPHDTQKCTFSVESYGHTRDKIELGWDRRKEKPVMGNSNITLLPFKLKNFKESEEVAVIGENAYKALRVEITLQRKTGFFINRLYIPFIFLVALSWLSFWIPAKMMALRLSLLLVILYLMVNIGYGINDFIPPASYTKGSDVWIAVCESLVFASFLEFIAVHVSSRKQEKLEKKMRKNDPEACRVLDTDAKTGNAMLTDDNCLTVTIMADRLKRDAFIYNGRYLDKICRILFPVLFLIFNFVYWLVYCVSS